MRITKIMPVGAKMHPTEYGFLVALLHQPVNLCDNVRQRAAAANPTGYSNNTKRAAIIATVLDFDKGAGVAALVGWRCGK